jgi:polyisoprenoid-binding protein YceI
MSVTTDIRPAVPTGTWVLDAVHSTIGFEVKYLVGPFSGRFTEVAARLEGTDDAVALSGSAKVAGVDVKDENLAAHLQSPEFFDAERYPKLTFRSNEIDRTGDGVIVRGEITIKGITRPVELTGKLTEPMVDGYGRDRIGLTLSTTVDRTAFGLNWNMPLPDGKPALANEVKLIADLFFVREQ